MLLLATCDTADRRECVADDCSCWADDDCVIEDCYFATLPHQGDYATCGPNDPCGCWHECDCTNGYPLPSRVRDELVAVDRGSCSRYYCEAWGSCDCFDVSVTYEPRCEWGRCVGVAVDP